MWSSGNFAAALLLYCRTGKGRKNMIDFLNWLDGVLWGVPLIALMVVTGLYFTIRSGFFQFRFFGWTIKRTA